MKMNKTNISLVIALLASLIAPKAVNVNFDELEVTPVVQGELTVLTANKDVTWLVLGECDYVVEGRTIILSKPVRVVAIYNNDYVMWHLDELTPPMPPPRPDSQLEILLKSWLPESNDYQKVAQNLEQIAVRLGKDELSSSDMIFASLEYLNRKSEIGPEWDNFFDSLQKHLDEEENWGKVFQVASEVCYAASRSS
jgi:hypothetical protein